MIIGPVDRVIAMVAAVKQVPGASPVRALSREGAPVRPGEEPATVDRVIETVRSVRRVVHDGVPDA